jgi:hypothetical protein
MRLQILDVLSATRVLDLGKTLLTLRESSFIGTVTVSYSTLEEVTTYTSYGTVLSR